MIVAGIDEAGYGPTLGPLVVSMSVFRVPDSAVDLWRALAKAVARKPDGRKVPVEDSKKLFQQGKGLRNLEEGLLPFLQLRDGVPRDFRALLHLVSDQRVDAASAADTYLERYPWYRGRNAAIPCDTYLRALETRARRLEAALLSAGVEFLGCRSRPVEVIEFNEAVAREENKANVAFSAVGGLIRSLWRAFADEAVEVVVDHQGGRSRYAPLVFGAVRPRSIIVEKQERDLSAYRLLRSGEGGEDGASGAGAFRVVFAIESESRSLPVALASMLSKYLRELHMHIFNAFWREVRTDLRPTAGYATDAARFLDDIAPLRRRLAIDDAFLIRCR